MDISHNGEAMTLRPDVVQKAVKDGIELWLFNTVISNREELHNLLTNELALDEIWVDSTKSYACRNLDKVAACVGLGGIHGTKSMSPNLFLPLDMCGCRPGYAGTGTNCSVCPANTFNSRNNQTICQPCPPKARPIKVHTNWQQLKKHVDAATAWSVNRIPNLFVNVLRMKPSAKLMTENTVYTAANITRNA